MKRCGVQPYSGPEKFIFIVCCHRDKKYVYPILEQMTRDGFKVWFDEETDTGEEWPEIIMTHLNLSSACIAFLSENSLQSYNCRREINFALLKRKTVVTVVLEPVRLSLGMEMQLGAVQAIFKYTLEKEQDFFSKLYDVDALKACQGLPDDSVYVSRPEEYEENLKDLYGIDEIQRKRISDKWFAEAGKAQDGEEIRQPAVLIRLKTNEEIMIFVPEMVVGRLHPDIDYSIAGNSAVSRIHARIVCRDNAYYLSDCGSLNSTFLNAQELCPGQECLLQEGDIIRFANERFRFHRMEGQV